MPLDPKALTALQHDLGHQFSNQQWLREALTHSTHAYEHPHEALGHNERLEFLGDAVLDLAVSDLLFSDPKGYDEGFMTQTRALLVCEDCLADLARQLDLGPLLQLGRGEEATGGRQKSSNLSNAMEAVFGALYLDAGFEKAGATITRLLQPALAEAKKGRIVRDYKSRLLERSQAGGRASDIAFVILDESGPVHDRTFTAGVKRQGKLIAKGQGKSKKEAEQRAAQKALGDPQNLD